MAKTLTIAGVDYLPYYKTNSATIKEALRKTNVMNMEIITKSIATAPQEGSESIFKDGSRFLFGGYISKVEPTETGKGVFFNYKVEVSDYAYIFNSKIARRAYTNQTLNYIVNDLITTYVGTSYGFDLTNVQTGPTIATVSFDYVSIRSAFEKLAKLTGYVWYVDYEKNLYWQTPTTEAAPETITDGGTNIETMNITYDTSQVRNSVTVIGSTDGVESMALITETFIGDGETIAWELGEKPSTVASITVNGVSKQFSLDVNERDGDIFTYSYSGQSFKRVSGPLFTGSDTIVISYYPRIPIIEELTDDASIAFFAALDGGTGIYEYTIKDNSIGSIAEANARALQELQQYGTALADGRIVTRSGLLASPTNRFKPGQALTINSPTQGLSSDTVFTIQEVQIAVLDGTTSEYKYTIRFGGKIVSMQEFLSTLAAKQIDGEQVASDTEIITIEHLSDAMAFSDSDTPISMNKSTPPFKWGAGSSPQAVWNLSEWS